MVVAFTVKFRGSQKLDSASEADSGTGEGEGESEGQVGAESRYGPCCVAETGWWMKTNRALALWPQVKMWQQVTVAVAV